MKSLFNLISFYIFATLIICVSVKSQKSCGRGCVPECGPDEELYSSGCKPFLEEASCENPNPQVDPDAPGLCDLMACYCKAPKVRYYSNGTGHCVTVDKCPRKGCKEN